MGPQEMMPEFFGKAFRYLAQRDAAGVGGNDGAGAAERLDFTPQQSFKVQFFGDGFDDPIGF